MPFGAATYTSGRTHAADRTHTPRQSSQAGAHTRAHTNAQLRTRTNHTRARTRTHTQGRAHSHTKKLTRTNANTHRRRARGHLRYVVHHAAARDRRLSEESLRVRTREAEVAKANAEMLTKHLQHAKDEVPLRPVRDMSLSVFLFLFLFSFMFGLYIAYSLDCFNGAMRAQRHHRRAVGLSNGGWARRASVWLFVCWCACRTCT